MMNQALILSAALLLGMNTARAAEHFRTANLPDGRLAEITVAQCENGQCGGEGSVILKKGGFRQTFTSDDLWFGHEGKNRILDYRKPEEKVIAFTDYNFDGRPDLTIPSGNIGPYGTRGYDVYVQTRSGRFVYSDELSGLFQMYMLVDIDRKNKLLKTFGKSGAAIHFADWFRVVPGKGLQLIYQCESRAGIDDDRILITEKRLANGKWRTSRKRITEKQWSEQNC